MTFGTRFRDARLALELTQDRAADQLGVSKATISAWERDLKLPETSRLPEIQRLLRQSLDWLIGVSDNNNRLRQERGSYSVSLLSDLRPDESLLLDRFRALSPSRQKALIAFLSHD